MSSMQESPREFGELLSQRMSRRSLGRATLITCGALIGGVVFRDRIHDASPSFTEKLAVFDFLRNSRVVMVGHNSAEDEIEREDVFNAGGRQEIDVTSFRGELFNSHDEIDLVKLGDQVGRRRLVHRVGEIKERSWPVFFDLKFGKDDKEAMRQFNDVIHTLPADLEIVITSKDHGMMHGFDRRSNANRIISMTVETQDQVNRFLQLVDIYPGYAISLRRDMATTRNLKELIDRNVRVFAWTVNSLSEMVRLRQAGVYGLITDKNDYIGGIRQGKVI